MPNMMMILGEKYPRAFLFAVHKATDILRRFPYQPVIQGGGEVDGPEWLEVRPSRIPNAGNGLFTTQFCAEGTVLCEYKGTRLTGSQLLRTRDWTYIDSYGRQFFIDSREHPRVKGRYINHHFDASKRNVRWAYRDERIFLEASRDIQPDEEYWLNHRYWNGWA
jgi:hypothetical protein